MAQYNYKCMTIIAIYFESCHWCRWLSSQVEIIVFPTRRHFSLEFPIFISRYINVVNFCEYCNDSLSHNTITMRVSVRSQHSDVIQSDEGKN